MLAAVFCFMAKVTISEYEGRKTFSFQCPGCKESHNIGETWQFNGDVERPTFSPSILVKSGHYADTLRHDHPCWCDHNAEMIAKGEEPSGFECGICHSFVRDGKIEFLSDCTHALAGQTVELPEIIEP